ncbi:GntR family transcriptional regulator [Desulfosporosinus sp.]|uniref:GntR family transcriptional regulator n=1 Tax=Desulfosporosinus sp. TaxID=157907 RepID=UPI000E9231D2|nr:GntR family transcriptional regulator [Desulfosporosinus sp.]MBC2723460.1 GntR family transcriptional regulator [Desulfosporosinus sp.]MBC2726595.1 GntR family transcriptional regulator [Desulfosporosinus sp.]HBV87640.1 GntR family transcriptional regulator [Desulfosporosinus sp.]
MAHHFSPIKFDDNGHIRDSVFSILRNAILDKKLEPGQRLVERTIAEQMGISRTPVREAINKLILERLVTHIPRKGVVVSGFTKADIVEILFIRTSLEALICSIAANKIKPRELKRLESLAKQISDEHGKGNLKKSNQLNDKFHEIIYRSAESPRVYSFLNTLHEYISKFTQVAYSKPGRPEEVWVEHNAIIEALRKHDSSAAEVAAKSHAENSCKAYLEMAFLADDIKP